MMDTVSLEILRSYILSEGGVVSSQQVVKKFQPFLKDPINKERNRELFKSYLSTLADYRHEEGTNTKILELKRAYRTDSTPASPRNDPLQYRDQLQPMREAQHNHEHRRDVQCNERDVQRTERDVQHTEHTRRQASRERDIGRSDVTQPARERDIGRSDVTQPARERDMRPEVHSPRAGSRLAREYSTHHRRPRTPDSADNQDHVVSNRGDKPVIRRASINAINMFNRTAQQKKAVSVLPPEPATEDRYKGDTIDSNIHEDLREDMESGCSHVPLEQCEKEWIIKSAVGDCDAISRLLLTDKNLILNRDFISGYTGLHWSCKLGRVDMATILLEAGSDVNQKSNSGQTPLHLAAQTGDRDLIELIVRYHGDKDVRDHKGKKPGYYLPPTSSEHVKVMLAVPDLSQPISLDPLTRKYSKSTLPGFELTLGHNPPKRGHTINLAWKKYKSSFVTKRSKKESQKGALVTQKLESKQRDSLTSRFDAKENQKYRGSPHTLPVNQSSYF